ncbi:hypothetical protein [Pontibacter roseus]|uniref:hypothetical protein n=1 Tax=Pontibacter roseus TaxID=336989 RepID=UPI0012FB291E|nr:hypothetical protein [Pontibacter roseus]
MNSLRHLVLPFALVWACLFLSHSGLASDSYSSTVKAEQRISRDSEHTPHAHATQNLGQETLYLSEAATPSVVSFNLQPVGYPLARAYRANAASNGTSRPKSATPGTGFLGKFFPSCIQPNAP